MSDGKTPQWPEDILYIPIEDGDKGPETSLVGKTWNSEGKGCYDFEDKWDRRWGIVDVKSDDYRLLTIDIDLYKMGEEKKQRVNEGINKSPDTRIHASQSGGKHYLYWVKKSELTDDEKLPISLEGDIDDKLNGYVLGPSCEGYSVESDREPAEISIDDIPDEWIDPGTEKSEPTFDGEHPEPREGEIPTVYDVITRSNHPEGERVAHPYHVSDTKMNFMVDDGAETWRCWRHDVTGNALHLLGIQEGLMSCGDWKEGNVPTSVWKTVFDAAEERGLIEPSYTEREEGDHLEILEDRRQYESIDEAEFPTSDFNLDKPPREGGSYWSMKNMIEQPTVILVPRHSIGEYHTETLSELLPDGETVVRLEGKHRVCENSGKDCPKAPETFIEWHAMKAEVRGKLIDKTTITAEDVPEEFCNYLFLALASSISYAVVTVPSLLPALDRDFENDKLLIDEEQTLDFFRPGSVDLMEFHRSVEPDGEVTIQAKTPANITTELKTLREITQRIEEDQQQRKERAEEEGREWQRTSAEKNIQAAMEYFESVSDVLGVTDAKETLEANGEDPTLRNVIELFSDRLEEIERPEPTKDPDDLRAKLNEYAAPYFWDDSVNPSSVIETILFPYTESPFYFKRTGSTITLRMVGGSHIFHADLLKRFNQRGIIAGTEGERFFDDLGIEATAIEITDFKYSDDFAVLPIAKKSDDELEPASKQRRRVKRASKLLNENAHPHIAITGTKEQARNHHSTLTEGMSDIVSNPESPAKDMSMMYSAGETAIIYENSVVSRGIDTPFYDVSVVASSGFAAPYWEARKDYYKGRDREKYAEALSMEREIKSKELTNAVFRMAPTRAVDDMTGMKFAVISDWDSRRIKYLDGRKLPRVAYAKAAANFTQQLTRAGGFEITTSQALEGVDGNEKEYIEIAMRERLFQTPRDNPSYDFDTLESWREDNYFTSEDTTDQVLSVFAMRSPPIERGELLSEVPGWSDDRIMAGINVLIKLGIIERETKETGGKGRPKVVYRVSYEE